MRKLIQAFRFESILVPSLSQNYHSSPSKSLLSLITSFSAFSHNRACSSTPDLNARNSVLANYLVGSLKFSKERAFSFSSSFSGIKSLEKPKEVIHFLKGLGFSDEHIQSIAHSLPHLLFANVEKTLKPKVIYFQELGLSGPHLRALISRNPHILYRRVERSLKPCICLIKKVLQSDGRNRSHERINDDLFSIIIRYNRILGMECRLEENILYLESCGVVGSQLSTLLVRYPVLFSRSKEKLEELVSRAVDMNFAMGSRMLAPAIQSLNSMSIKALNSRIELFRMFGFSKDEFGLMFRKSPLSFRLSLANLRCKLKFFLNNVKINKLVIVRYPVLLSLSLEERVIPRYKVLEILKSRRLLTGDISFTSTMSITNQQFLEKYILRFKNDAKELLLAYNSKVHDTSEK